MRPSNAIREFIWHLERDDDAAGVRSIGGTAKALTLIDARRSIDQAIAEQASKGIVGDGDWTLKVQRGNTRYRDRRIKILHSYRWSNGIGRRVKPTEVSHVGR